MDIWNEITTQEEIDGFMKVVWGFHDTCLKEMKYVSGAYLSKEHHGMYPVNNKRILNVIFQGNFKNLSVSAIEVEFIGLRYLSLRPDDEYYTCEILGATMAKKENYIYWCDLDGLPDDNYDRYECTVICSERFRWRRADEFLGEDEEFYVSRFDHDGMKSK
jgi:hypothetical protein